MTMNTRYVCPECGIEVISASDSVILFCAACRSQFTAKPQLVTTQTKQAGPPKWNHIANVNHEFLAHGGYHYCPDCGKPISHSAMAQHQSLYRKSREMAELLRELFYALHGCLETNANDGTIGCKSEEEADAALNKAERLLADLEAV